MAFGSPFGLAYGLGAGMANVPQAYTTGVDQGLAESMKKLQLQEYQRQMQEGQDIDKASAQGLDESKLPQVPVMGANPEAAAQRQQNQQNIQSQIDQYGDEGQNAGPGAFTPTVPEQVQTGTKPMDLSGKPFLRQQLEHQQVADRLRQLGRGRAAMAMEQQAGQFGMQHHQQMSTNFSRAVIMGDFNKATDIAKDLGYNVAKISPGAKAGEIQLHAVGADGSPIVTDMPLVALMDIGDPAKAAALINTLTWRMDQTQTRRDIAGNQIQSKEKEGAANRQNRIEVANIHASRPAGIKGSVNTAIERQVASRAQSFLDNDTTGTLTPEQATEKAWNVMKPSIEAKGYINDKDELRSLQAEQKQLSDRGKTKTPEYLANQQRIQALRTVRPGANSSGGVIPPAEAATRTKIANFLASPGAKTPTGKIVEEKLKAKYKELYGKDY